METRGKGRRAMGMETQLCSSGEFSYSLLLAVKLIPISIQV